MEKEFTTPFEEISLQELNKCLQKFYLFTRKCDGCLMIARQNNIVTVGNSKSLLKKSSFLCSIVSLVFLFRGSVITTTSHRHRGQ